MFYIGFKQNTNNNNTPSTALKSNSSATNMLSEHASTLTSGFKSNTDRLTFNSLPFTSKILVDSLPIASPFDCLE